jgi:PilZ domain
MQINNKLSKIRREHERLDAHISALLHVRKQFQTVTVVDYSQGGVQLQGSFGLMPRDVVTLELLSGQRIGIEVMWSLGSRLGARFAPAIAADDPVLAALDAAAKRGSGLRKPARSDVALSTTGLVSSAA